MREHKIGDLVYLIKRKSTGYPKQIKEGVGYYIAGSEGKDNDVLIVKNHSLDGKGWNPPIKVHCTYMSGLSTIRNMKIEELLKEK